MIHGAFLWHFCTVWWILWNFTNYFVASNSNKKELHSRIMSTRPWKKIQLKNIFLLLPFKPLTSILECRSLLMNARHRRKNATGKNFMGRSSGAKKLIIFITLCGSLSSNIHTNTIISHTASWQTVSSMNEINLCVNIWRIFRDPFSRISHWNNFKVNVVCIIFHSDFFSLSF